MHLDGCVNSDSRIFGTYLHGLFDEDEFRHAFIATARAFHALAPAAFLDDWKRKRERSFDRLADAIRGSVDMHRIFEWVGLSYHPSPTIEETGH
jgi:adenosylcobyric acid synthase